MRDPETILITLSTFFIALAAGLLFSTVLKRFKIPWAITLILGGMAIGPYGLGIIEINDVLMFLSEIGLIFLMFLAGTEVNISAIKNVWKESAIAALLTGLLPALTGFSIALLFGYNLLIAITLGIILINTSFAVVVPALEAKGLINTKIGKIVVASTMYQDIASLTIFAILVQLITPETFLPLPLWAVLLIFALGLGITIKVFLPKLKEYFKKYEQSHRKGDFYEGELKITLIILIAMAIIFEFFKFETIVGAFFAGVLISEAVKSEKIQEKIHTLGYGVFIPMFFITIGIWTDLTLFIQTLALTTAIVIGSMIAKFVAGWTAGRIAGLDNKDSGLIAFTSVPQLITTLALATIAESQGLLPSEILIAIITLAVISTIIGPLLTNKHINSNYVK